MRPPVERDSNRRVFKEPVMLAIIQADGRLLLLDMLAGNDELINGQMMLDVGGQPFGDFADTVSVFDIKPDGLQMVLARRIERIDKGETAARRIARLVE